MKNELWHLTLVRVRIKIRCTFDSMCPFHFEFKFMKSKLLWVSFFVFSLSSCNEIPDICLERTPIPVIYSVFNKYDSVNYIYITKTWSGDNGGTLVTAKKRISRV